MCLSAQQIKTTFVETTKILDTTNTMHTVVTFIASKLILESDSTWPLSTGCFAFQNLFRSFQ
jgi:hypothetical protein